MKLLALIVAGLALAGCIDMTNPTTAPSSSYHVLFRDDFNAPCVSFPCDTAHWWAYPPTWTDTSGHGHYDCTKVCSEHDGVLDLRVHTEAGTHYVAAPVPKLQPGSHPYGTGLSGGRYTIRFKSDRLPGYKLAWLLWPDSGDWPHDGEVDFPELNLDGTDTISAFMHHQNGTSGGDQDGYDTNVVPTDGRWHTATTEWRPDSPFCSFYLDGRLVGTSLNRVPNTPMHWVIQTETALSGTPSDTVAGHVLIDDVEVDTI